MFSATKGHGIAISSNSVVTHPQDGPDFIVEDARLLNYLLPYLYDHNLRVLPCWLCNFIVTRCFKRLWSCLHTRTFFVPTTHGNTARDDFRKLPSAIYLQINTIIQALNFVTRSRSWSFVERPGWLLALLFLLPNWIGGWGNPLKWVECIVLFFHSSDFAEATAKDSGAGTKEYVHIRIQHQNGRKSLTTIQGLKKDFSYNKTLKNRRSSVSMALLSGL